MKKMLAAGLLSVGLMAGPEPAHAWGQLFVTACEMHAFIQTQDISSHTLRVEAWYSSFSSCLYGL